MGFSIIILNQGMFNLSVKFPNFDATVVKRTTLTRSNYLMFFYQICHCQQKSWRETSQKWFLIFPVFWSWWYLFVKNIFKSLHLQNRPNASFQLPTQMKVFLFFCESSFIQPQGFKALFGLLNISNDNGEINLPSHTSK